MPGLYGDKRGTWNFRGDTATAYERLCCTTIAQDKTTDENGVWTAYFCEKELFQLSETF